MDIQVKSSNGITLVPIESRLMAERKIFIEGEINAESACEFIKKVILLNSEALDSPIDVLINSTGGEINSGMLMYDVIQSSSAPIRTFCIGKAYSMAAILLACGNHGRYILPHGELMIHEPLIISNISGSSSSIKSISDSLLETKETMNQILSKHTGRAKEEIEKATEFDHYFNPKEGIEFGLCDEIVEFNKIMGGR